MENKTSSRDGEPHGEESGGGSIGGKEEEVEECFTTSKRKSRAYRLTSKILMPFVTRREAPKSKLDR